MIPRSFPPRRLHMATIAKQARVEDSAELVTPAMLATLPAVVLVASSSELLSIQIVSKAFALSTYVVHIIGSNFPTGLDGIETAAGALVGCCGQVETGHNREDVDR